MKKAITRDITKRLDHFLGQRDSILSDRQFQVIADIAEHISAGEEYGYIKRPTGTGKTVTFAALIDALNPKPNVFDLPALVIAPRNLLTTQIKDTFTNPDLFDYDPSVVGVYHSECSVQEQQHALQAPILVTTYPSAMNLIRKGKINPADYPLIMLDEVHRARGDVIRPFIQENMFGQSLVLGWTATDRFISGQTIGDYLFHGQDPMHITTFRDAVEYGELAPVKNIIIETEAFGGRIKGSGGNDFTAEQMEKIARQAGRDEKALGMYANYRDPESGAYFREMSAVFYAVNRAHARHVTQKINAGFGQGHAVMVSGDTPKKELDAVIDDYRVGKIKAIVNADLLIEGFDAPNAQICFMLRPTRSPIVCEQTGGRVMRKDKNNPDKIAYVVTLVDSNIPDMAIFGDIAGGYFIAPEDFHMPITSGPTIDYFIFLTREKFAEALNIDLQNAEFIALWQKIEAAYEQDPEYPQIGEEVILCKLDRQKRLCVESSAVDWARNQLGISVDGEEDNNRILVGGSSGASGGGTVPGKFKDWPDIEDIQVIDTDERLVEFKKRQTALIVPEKTDDDLDKSAFVRAIGTSITNQEFTALWQAINDAYSENPDSPTIDGYPLKCAFKRNANVTTLYVDKSMVEWAKSRLGKDNSQKTTNDLNKSEFASAIGISSQSPYFNTLWQSIEDAHKNNSKNPVVDGQPIKCGIKKSGFVSVFCVHDSALEWAKLKLGKATSKKTDDDLTKYAFASEIGVGDRTEQFTSLWEEVENAHKKNPKNPTIDGQQIKCGMKQSGKHNALYIDRSMVGWAQSRLGKDIPQKTDDDLGKSEFARAMRASRESDFFTSLWQDMENAHKANPKNPTIDGQPIKCGIKQSGSLKLFCVDESMVEWAKTKQDSLSRTADDLTKQEFASEVGVGYSSSPFMMLWQSVENAHKKNPKNPVVDGQPIKCAFKKSGPKQTLFIEKCMVEWAKWKLGKESAYKPEQEAKPKSSAAETARNNAELSTEDTKRRNKKQK